MPEEDCPEAEPAPAVVVEEEPVFAELVGVAVGIGLGVGLGVEVVVVPVEAAEVPDDGWALDEPAVEDEVLPVDAFAEELPAVVEVEPVVLVDALAEPVVA